MLRRNSLKLSAGHCRERRGLHHIPPPVTPLDMPQSLCALDHAGTGKEGSSAKRERHREKLRMMDGRNEGMQRESLIKQCQMVGEEGKRKCAEWVIRLCVELRLVLLLP